MALGFGAGNSGREGYRIKVSGSFTMGEDEKLLAVRSGRIQFSHHPMSHLPQVLLTAAVWGVLLPFLAAVISTGTVFWLFSLPLRRLPRDAHWSEAARLYWHLRIARIMGTIWIVIAACAASYGDLSASGDVWMLVPVALSAVAGCVTGYREAGRGLVLPDTLRSGNLRSTFAQFILFPALPAMLAIMAFTWRRGLGWESFAFTAGVLLVLVALCVGGSVAILRVAGLLQPVDEALQKSSRELASAQGVPLRHVMRLDLPMANAFAFPWTKDLGFTRATLDILDAEELASVIGHELGHLKEGLATRWTRLIGLLAVSTVSLAPAAIHDGRPLLAAGFFAAYVLISRFGARFHKRLEVSADQEAHLSEAAEGVYARALEKIHATSLIPAVLHPRSPYPSLYDRMTSSGITPDFPRSAPPGRLLPLLCGVAATALYFFLWQGLGHAASDLMDSPPAWESRR